MVESFQSLAESQQKQLHFLTDINTLYMECDMEKLRQIVSNLLSKADINSKIEGLQQGADAYLEKPFNKEKLLVRIKKLLEMRKTLQQY